MRMDSDAPNAHFIRWWEDASKIPGFGWSTDPVIAKVISDLIEDGFTVSTSGTTGMDYRGVVYCWVLLTREPS